MFAFKNKEINATESQLGHNKTYKMTYTQCSLYLVCVEYYPVRDMLSTNENSKITTEY